MNRHTITLSALDTSITYSVKDDSVRGCHTEQGENIEIGDKILIDNYFHEVIEEPATVEHRTAEEVTADIIAYFEENESIYNECIEQLDSWNGYLSDDRYYFMDELQELYHGTNPIEILQRAYYGHDDDTWTTDSHGNKEYGQFNPNREYFKFNGYGNLVSTDYKDYTHLLDKYVVEEMSENRQYIDSIDENVELATLFDELTEE